MTCLSSLRRKDRKAAVQVAGTWDYKWPLGKHIKVAFQRPANPDLDQHFAEAVELVKNAARLWNEGAKQLGKVSPEQGVCFDVEKDLFLEKPLSPEQITASFADAGVAGAAVKPPQQNRLASFVEVLAHRSPAKSTGNPPYDILISFEDLPIERVDPFRISTTAQEPISHRVYLPFSELGSYARRVDYGEPTMFIGRFGAVTKQGLSLLDYLKSPLGRQTLVHELGHALGLAHSHQNPNFEDDEIGAKLQTAEQIAEELGNVLGGIEEKDVNEEILGRWPGDPRFSDWVNPERGIEKLESVMTYAYFDLLLKDHAGKIEERFKELLKPESKKEIALTPIDREQLRLMYWPDQAGAQQ